tara:strand:+ start:100 stop:462 length:363 start_codon:yes stop_codon:yes gene_type:complete
MNCIIFWSISPQKPKKTITFEKMNFKMFFLSPFWPFTALKITSLKATSTLLLFLLIKSNLLRLKGGLIGGLVALTLISGLIVSSTVAGGAAYYIFRNKKYNDDKVEFPDEDVINTEAVTS